MHSVQAEPLLSARSAGQPARSAGRMAAVAVLAALCLLAPWPGPAMAASAQDTGQAQALLEGRLTYPSEYIPDMVVCAETPGHEARYCTPRMRRPTIKTVWKLAVPPGVYYVYALPQEDVLIGVRHYHTRFTACGELASCTSHEVVPVRAEAGRKVGGLLPTDPDGVLP